MKTVTVVYREDGGGISVVSKETAAVTKMLLREGVETIQREQTAQAIKGVLNENDNGSCTCKGSGGEGEGTPSRESEDVPGQG